MYVTSPNNKVILNKENFLLFYPNHDYNVYFESDGTELDSPNKNDKDKEEDKDDEK